VLLGLALVCAKLQGAGIAGIYILFVLLGLTTGCVGFPYGVMISHWFNRKRGLAH
jgi:hypothetical protein